MVDSNSWSLLVLFGLGGNLVEIHFVISGLHTDQ